MEGMTLSQKVANRITNGVKSTAAFSIYPPAVYITELTTAQALMAALFHCLCTNDQAAATLLISVAGDVPHIHSSFLRIWLRDDFQFLHLDVKKCLATLAQLTVKQNLSLQFPIIIVITSLEEKYSLLGYFSKSLLEWTKQSRLSPLKEQVLGKRRPVLISSAPAKPSVVTESVDANTISEDQNANTSSTPTQITPKVSISKEKNPKETQPSTKGIWRMYTTIQNKLQSGVELIKGVTPILCRKPSHSAPLKKNQDEDAWSIIDESETSETVQEDQGVEEIPSLTVPSNSVEEAIEAWSHAMHLLSVETILASQYVDFSDAKLEFNFMGIAAEGKDIESQMNLVTNQTPVQEQDIEARESQMEFDTTNNNVQNEDQIRVASSRYSSRPEGEIQYQERLWTAVYRNDPLAASEAISAGASPCYSNNWNDTPLHLAASRGNHQMVKLLITAGAVVNHRSDIGCTPLHYAAANGHHRCVYVLLQAGADLNARDRNGKTPNMLPDRRALADVKRSGGRPW